MPKYPVLSFCYQIELYLPGNALFIRLSRNFFNYSNSQSSICFMVLFRCFSFKTVHLRTVLYRFAMFSSDCIVILLSATYYTTPPQNSSTNNCFFILYFSHYILISTHQKAQKFAFRRYRFN